MLIKKNFLICLAGLPSSGKSTFAQMLKEKFEKIFSIFKVLIVDPDKIRNEISPGKFDFNKEQVVRTKNLDAIRTALKNQFIVISDDLNYFSSMRHDLKKIADNLSIKYFIVHITTPLDVCLKWNKKRGKSIPNNVIKRISNKFDNFDKYSWDYPIIRYDPTNFRPFDGKTERIIEEIIEKIVIKVNSKIKNEKFGEDSNIKKEKLDCVTRKIVGELIRDPLYVSFKKEIIGYRKLFLKNNIITTLDDVEITKFFKKYLEQHLNMKIS